MAAIWDWLESSSSLIRAVLPMKFLYATAPVVPTAIMTRMDINMASLPPRPIPMPEALNSYAASSFVPVF